MNKANEHSHKFYDHEYQIVTWDEFHNRHQAGGFGITDEHLERAHEIAKSLPESEKRNWVVYDPLDHADGWMLVGENREELIKETIETKMDI